MRKIYLLDDEDCTPCEEVKKELEEEIKSGKVEVLQVTSEEALQLLQKAGATDQVEFPSALVEDDKGVRLCQIYRTKDITLSKCGDASAPLGRRVRRLPLSSIENPLMLAFFKNSPLALSFIAGSSAKTGAASTFPLFFFASPLREL